MDLEFWFTAQVLTHQVALTRYLRRVWRNRTEVPDLIQDIFTRVYETSTRALPAHPKAFLFATARNLLADRIRRERIVSINYMRDVDELKLLVDEISPEQRLSGDQELRLLCVALGLLSDDCRDVIWLRRVEGLSQREVASRLGLPEGTIESHLCRGLRALTDMTGQHPRRTGSARNTAVRARG